MLKGKNPILMPKKDGRACTGLQVVLKSLCCVVLGGRAGISVSAARAKLSSLVPQCNPAPNGPLHLPQKAEKSSSDHFRSSSTKFITQHKEDKI